MSARPRYWAVVPAAGVGRRMGTVRPKQYLDLAGRAVIDWTLCVLLEEPAIVSVVVAINPEDPLWSQTRFADHPRVWRVDGGPERCDSVLNALEALAGQASESDWVLVHDAVRPCLRADDLHRLMSELVDDPVGGLLGLPVRDTMKRAGGERQVIETVPRQDLWHALTPQMFRVGLLIKSLKAAVAAGTVVTDEAMAMERAGLAPRLLEGHGDNLKITRPEDLALAKVYLGLQGRLGTSAQSPGIARWYRP